MEVGPEVLIICLSDMNGGIKSLEPHIETDSNGKMVEEWTEKYGLHHLNQSEKCIGVYTFSKKGGKKSAIDHILVNDKLSEKFKGMQIDENKEQLNISDHNLVRAWFNIGGEEKLTWKKPKYERIEWFKKDPDSMNEMEKDLIPMIGKKVGFNDFMRKIKISQERKVKNKKNRKEGGHKNSSRRMGR